MPVPTVPGQRALTSKPAPLSDDVAETASMRAPRAIRTPVTMYSGGYARKNQLDRRLLSMYSRTSGCRSTAATCRLSKLVARSTSASKCHRKDAPCISAARSSASAGMPRVETLAHRLKQRARCECMPIVTPLTWFSATVMPSMTGGGATVDANRGFCGRRGSVSTWPSCRRMSSGGKLVHWMRIHVTEARAGRVHAGLGLADGLFLAGDMQEMITRFRGEAMYSAISCSVPCDG
ncbi:8a18408e-945d-4ad5-bbbb-a5eee6e34d06 [Thermothielavioides terrestris]|uniref:8a18408e-945d-4ad5-bbbb-a5eee6e34d06 n=1 Tax=Thermothielavioides terrestris TaxID=2587410 RepID=A0A446B7C8_9PEZI|nr:8a18408e-945d-4ad5-bbbb-a5eee6e34d06 [Thermothielavioides terrestris]